MCPVLASAGGERHRLRGYKLQAHFCLGRRQILLHGPSAGAGKPDRECLNDAAYVCERVYGFSVNGIRGLISCFFEEERHQIPNEARPANKSL